MKKYVIVVLVVSLAILIFSIVNKPKTKSNTSVNVPTTATNSDGASSTEEEIPMNFVAVPQTSEHHVSNTPEHAQILKSSPEKVTVTFDIVLASTSTMVVTDRNTGVKVGDGEVAFSEDYKTMEIKLKSDLGDGQYSVLYSECLTDSSCKSGAFQYGVKK